MTPIEKDRADYDRALRIVLRWMRDTGYAAEMHSEDAATDAQALAGEFGRALASARAEALADACRAMCDLCREGGPAPKRVGCFTDGVDRWMHRGDMWSECHAGPIRDLVGE